MTLPEAAAALWGPAGEYLYATYGRFRDELFPEQLPASLPMVIGLTAYGRCVGLASPYERNENFISRERVFESGGVAPRTLRRSSALRHPASRRPSP